MEQLKNKKIKIGIFGADNSKILMIATVNEFGCNITITPKMRKWLHANGLHVKDSTQTINIPERSYIRRTFTERKTEIDNQIRQGLDELFTFTIDIETFLNRVGIQLQGLTRETLTDVTNPPDHPFTLEKKKPKANPLINTGQLRQSIVYKIE